jgi:hypothetical protein
MWMIGSLLAMATALAMAWVTRPRSEWSGGDAGRFCAAVILLPAGLLNALATGTQTGDLHQAAQLLLQLSLYAGLPLLAAIVVAEQLGHFFSRLIWGRALLAICAVFALLRTSPYLHYWLLLVLIAAGLGLLWGALQQRRACWLALPLWLLVLASFWALNMPQHAALWLWLAAGAAVLTAVRRLPEASSD